MESSNGISTTQQRTEFFDGTGKMGVRKAAHK